MPRRRFVSPFILPVVAFAATIFAGAYILWLDICAKDGPVSFVDTLFISTSAVCVTGLASVDPSTVFNRTGHSVMLVLIQLGGLGIMTYSTLIFYILGRRISLGDRLAVGQALLHDTSFHLGRFLQRIVLFIIFIEGAGAATLYLMQPERIGFFHSVFIAVSAFCNAGFALWPDNLVQWQQDWGVNLAVMLLITLGGLGFFVIDEVVRVGVARIKWRFRAKDILHPGLKPRLGWNSRLVISTSCFLTFGGAAILFMMALCRSEATGHSPAQLVLPALFQSVTCRTAGFATVDLGLLTDVSLLVMIILMVIGGSPGSCAGGLKTTTFRALVSWIWAELRGRSQVIVKGRALESGTLNKVVVLFFFSVLTIVSATLALAVTENAAAAHNAAPRQILDLLFEVCSAFGTVGLSVNLTPQLTPAGKLIICTVMFIGRLGPVCFITALKQMQTEPAYRLAESDLPIG